MPKSWEEIKRELIEPFAHEDVEWRIQKVIDTREGPRGLAVAYVTARAIQNRLDDVVGPQNWEDEYAPWHVLGDKTVSQLCTIRIYDPDRREWISKTDGAEDTDIEPVKGGLSDAYKRAAVKWGIGRYLYGLPATWVDTNEKNKKAIAEKDLPKLDKVHDDYVARLKGRKAGTPQASLSEKTTSGEASGTKPAPKPPIAITQAQKPVKYTVRKKETHKFSGIVHLILDLEQTNGDVISVYLSGADAAVKPGAVLQDVKIQAHTGKQDASRVFYTLEQYKIAA